MTNEPIPTNEIEPSPENPRVIVRRVGDEPSPEQLAKEHEAAAADFYARDMLRMTMAQSQAHVYELRLPPCIVAPSANDLIGFFRVLGWHGVEVTKRELAAEATPEP